MGLLFFSEIDVSASDGSKEKSFYASGHPDQADVRELLARDPSCAEAAAIAKSGAEIRVRHYTYPHSGNMDSIAEESHFAMIEAYDYLAEHAGAYGPFTWHPDVKRTAAFTIVLPAYKEECHHV